MNNNFLKLGICFQTLAQVIQVSLYGSALGTFLFLNLDIGESSTFMLEKIIALIMVGVVSLLLVNKFPQGILLVGLYFFIEAFMIWINGGRPHSQLSFFTHMARYLTPFAFYALVKGHEKVGINLLRWAIGFTFIFHGIKALQYNPLFIDYVMEGVEGLFGIAIMESGAKQILVVIGLFDVLFGVLAILKCPPWAYFYMALWGGITAWFRIYFHGDLGILPMFVRINHLLIPLYLGFYLKRPKVESLYV
ncbi:MAG: hypothetical protein DRQ88_13060 [Epsilonproteobacteria bacterium]|nr:MAG: hypothetical protein DRQ88_13060 [Campylobacterota bacterium]RLA62947.1 MAG: hypothetical protein DRQ89_08215 [Campylobacterota bacterium]